MSESERTIIAAPSAHLVLVRPADPGLAHPGARASVMSDGCKLGRDFDPGLGLARDPKVSRLHCEIVWKGGRWVIRDCGSSNGTFLNGRLLEDDAGIGQGDSLQIGDTVMRFTTAEPVACEVEGPTGERTIVVPVMSEVDHHREVPAGIPLTYLEQHFLETLRGRLEGRRHLDVQVRSLVNQLGRRKANKQLRLEAVRHLAAVLVSGGFHTDPDLAELERSPGIKARVRVFAGRPLPSAPKPRRSPAKPPPLPPDALADPGDEHALIARQAKRIFSILTNHGIAVREVNPAKAQVGPSVIRYRVRLQPGARLATLRARAADIGRELASSATPLIDNIAGENYVGIDLERPRRQIVPLLPAIERLPKPRGLALPIAVGVRPDGSHVGLDLVQMPHLLVAGSTGSGKTVFLHALLLSLIAKLPPDRLELLIIDPKATDFVPYRGLAHLRCEGAVVTEPNDAIARLQELTNDELRARTETLQRAGCPNLIEYNTSHPHSILKPIVVVIDEYADLVAVLPKRQRGEFEREVIRLAQRARSVGIHLVIATQRPSTDVVTGLLKTNMPCRIAFRMPQRVDSQTILDQLGAENLFGRGDMLLLLADSLTRIQGYLVSPAEIASFLQTRA